MQSMRLWSNRWSQGRTRDASGSRDAKVFDWDCKRKDFGFHGFICGVFLFVELVERVLLDSSFLAEKLIKGNMSSNFLVIF